MDNFRFEAGQGQESAAAALGQGRVTSGKISFLEDRRSTAGVNVWESDTMGIVGMKVYV